MGSTRTAVRTVALAVAFLSMRAPHSHSAAQPAPALAAAAPRGLTGTIVFESDAGGRPAIYTLDLAAGRVAHLTGATSSTSQTPRWSPDGRRVVFVSNRAHYEGPRPESGTPDMDVWIVDADGSGARRLTDEPSNEHDPAWTADGGGIVFSSDRDSRGDLYVKRLDSGVTTRLTRHFVGRAIMPAPSVAPERIAFAAQSMRAGAFWAYQVHVRDTRGEVSTLSETIGGCWPRWSPDGRRLAHVRSNVGATPSALEVRDGPTLAGSRVYPAQGLWSYYPAWSPDATRLVFSVSPAHHDGEDWDLAVVDLATGAWQRLTQGKGNDRLPDWKK